MADEKVTPIQPGVKPKKPRDRDESLRRQMRGFQYRLAHATALARAMAVAFQDQYVLVGNGEIDAFDGMNGIAALIDGIRSDMVNLGS